nr:CXXXC motif protein [uncultured Acidobacteriota bacterium]
MPTAIPEKESKCAINCMMRKRNRKSKGPRRRYAAWESPHFPSNEQLPRKGRLLAWGHGKHPEMLEKRPSAARRRAPKRRVRATFGASLAPQSQTKAFHASIAKGRACSIVVLGRLRSRQ